MLARVALRFTAWAERWIPDAFVFALLATLLVFALGMAVAHATPIALVESWGRGFWEVISSTMQMSLSG
jgi:short-chain fatty acids transporter